MTLRGIAAVLMGAALAACSSVEKDYSGPETQGGASVNVFPEKYRAEILAYQRSYLNDPTGVRSAAISQPAVRKVGSVERYVVCVRFNAKQPSGGYAGVREHMAIFLAGKLDQMGVTRELCKDAAYEPFPELERLTR
ncbi:MAG: hypothetical protein WCE79_21080 [Xanthobacteraceae bacterium]